jgi:hypothetical protein
MALNRKLNFAIGLGEQCVVTSAADVFTGMELGTALTHDDVARNNFLAAKLFDA